MLDQQDIQTIEEVVSRVVEKRLDAFGVEMDQRNEKRLDAFGVEMDQRNEKRLDAFAATIGISFHEVRQELIAIHKRIDDLASHVDEFIHLHQKLEQEMTMVHARIDRLEDQIKQLQTRLAV